MPELKWDELDFLECLEVIPEVEEEYKTRYAYKIEKDELILTVVVWPMESVIGLLLRQSNSDFPLLECALFVQGDVTLINDKRGQYLEFRNCIVAPRRFSHREVTKFDDAATPSWSVEISIKPGIRLRYLD